MLKQTIALESLRQKIEKALFDAGSSFDYLDYGRPNEGQAKAARETIEKNLKEAELLKAELHTLIELSENEAVEEWVNWHKDVLQKILLEPITNSHTKTRATTARKTLIEWEDVRNRKRDYVDINWHFLKDYKKKASKGFKTSWWKF